MSRMEELMNERQMIAEESAVLIMNDMKSQGFQTESMEEGCDKLEVRAQIIDAITYGGLGLTVEQAMIDSGLDIVKISDGRLINNYKYKG